MSPMGLKWDIIEEMSIDDGFQSPLRNQIVICSGCMAPRHCLTFDLAEESQRTLDQTPRGPLPQGEPPRKLSTFEEHSWMYENIIKHQEEGMA